MAYYTISKQTKKNGIAYCARVRAKESGVVVFSKSKTFSTKTAATKWAKETVNKVEKNTNNELFDLIDCKLLDLINKYIDAKQASDKPLCRTTLYSLEQIKRYKISQILVSKLTTADVVNFALERKSSPSSPAPSTIAVDISCLRKVLKVSKSMFNVNIDDRPIINAYPALHDLKLIARSNKRERRLENNEYIRVINELKKKENHGLCSIPYADIFKISLLTCCRVNEVCNLLWSDLNLKDNSVLVRNRKSPNGSLGNNATLPLLGEAKDILLKQPKIDERIFPYKSRSITSGFRRTIKKLGITDLRYHDLRREGASKLIELGLTLEETARITGHNDLSILWQVYVSISPNHFDEFNSRNPKILE